jgi:hypothetical protein
MPELPPQTDGVLSEIQAQAVAILGSDPYFAGITVLPEDDKDILNGIQIALAKLGLCCVVMTPDTEFKFPDAPGPIMDTVKVAVQIAEFVLANRGAKGTRKPCGQVAEYVAWLLHYPNHAAEPARASGYRLIAKRIRTIPHKSYLIRQVDFETSGALAGIVTEE